MTLDDIKKIIASKPSRLTSKQICDYLKIIIEEINILDTKFNDIPDWVFDNNNEKEEVNAIYKNR